MTKLSIFATFAFLMSFFALSFPMNIARAEAPIAAAPPPDSSHLQDLGSFRPSYYWIALEARDGQPKNQPLLDEHGHTLQMVSAKFLTDLRMEGTGRLQNGKLVNFNTRVTLPNGTQESRWRWCGAEAPYGYGFGDLLLVPFRSVAVDPSVVPLGSRIYIPAARGAILPDGTVHDGIFVAVDIGSAIIDRKIDIFTSFGNQAGVFESFGMETGKMSKVYLVK